MELIYAQDNLSLGQMAARWVAREILISPSLVLGLPTGSTPIGMYQALTRLAQEGIISFAQARTFIDLQKITRSNSIEYISETAK